MVQAIMDGRKTQTRRTCNPQPELIRYCKKCGLSERVGCELPDCEFSAPEPLLHTTKNRCGQPGDRLWVREAWRTYASLDGVAPRTIVRGAGIQYEAGGTSIGGCPHLEGMGKYRPSMFMPRWASRLTLEITSVRMERLQDISEIDAKAEGADCLITANCTPEEGSLFDLPLMDDVTPYRNGYALLWDSINGPGSWGKNQWVWVIEFKVVNQ